MPFVIPIAYALLISSNIVCPIGTSSNTWTSLPSIEAFVAISTNLTRNAVAQSLCNARRQSSYISNGSSPSFSAADTSAFAHSLYMGRSFAKAMVPIDAQSKKATHTVATFLKKAFMFLLLSVFFKSVIRRYLLQCKFSNGLY